MKLFVIDHTSNQRVPITLVASTRADLSTVIGSHWFNLNGQNYNVNEVFAVAEANNTGPAVAIGGLIGLLGGPIGILAGGLIGGMLGNEGDKNETQKVNYFNNSRA